MLAVGAGLLGAFAPTVAHAYHIPHSIYQGTAEGGGDVDFFTFTDDGRVTSFLLDGPPGVYCDDLTGDHIDIYTQPLPVVNHAFSDTSGLFTVRGSFPAPQKATGTFRVKAPTCDTGNVPWSATTSSPPLPHCADLVDNDGDGKVDYPADPGCYHLIDNDETDVSTPAESEECDAAKKKVKKAKKKLKKADSATERNKAKKKLKKAKRKKKAACE